jgi:hypothetical protein
MAIFFYKQTYKKIKSSKEIVLKDFMKWLPSLIRYSQLLAFNLGRFPHMKNRETSDFLWTLEKKMGRLRFVEDTLTN